MADSSEEKTEKPTAHRLKEARKKGQVAKSNELTSAISLLVGVATVSAMATWMAVSIADLHLAVDRSIPGIHVANMMALLIETFLLVVMLSAAPLAITALVGTLVTGIQSGPVFSVEQVKPKFERMNPGENFKRLFSVRTIVQFGLMIIKLLIVGAAVLVIFKIVLPDAIVLIHAELGGALALSRRALMLLALWCGALFIVLGLADYSYQRYQWLKDLKMSLQELKREHKEQEGDPLIKSIRKSLADEPSPTELLEFVPRCSLVIAEAGDRAVALFYRKGVVAGPMVVVRGAGAVGRSIVETARGAQVAVRFDPVLTERLYASAVPGSVVNEAIAQEVLRLLSGST